MQGQYVITIQTDYLRNAPECGSGLNNNSADSSAFAVSNNLPDLVVDSVTAPAGPVGVGSSFQVDYTARNNGGQLTTNTGWRDYIYLSSDETLAGGDRFLGSVAMTSNLSPGETYSRSLTVNSGNVPAGQYYLLIKADGDNKVYEGPNSSTYETNNVRASIPVMFTSPGVDLQAVVNSVGTPTYSGMSTLVNWTVTNTGTTQTLANNWSDYIILSRDSIIDSSDKILGYAVREQALAGGASYTVSRAVSIPAGLTDLYRIFVITDYSNRIVEENDSNNTSPGYNVTLELPPPADLNVTNITVPASGTPGGSAVFQWTVQNSGAFPAVGPWRDSVYLSRDQFWDASDYLVGQRERTGQPLGVGQTEVEQAGMTIPFIEEGDYYVIVRLDSQNRVRETNEGNNVSVSVSQMPITVQTLTMNTPFMTQLLNGGTKSFRFDPPANETVLVSLTGEEGNSNELFTNFYTAASRADYDFQGSGGRTDDQENFIPNTETGRYYSMVSHDYIPHAAVLKFNKQPEKIVNGQVNAPPVPPQNITISADVLPFSINAISPTTAGNAGEASITIRGAKFLTGATVKLVGPNNEIVPPRVTVVGSTVIRALFDLKGFPAAVYDVVVTNPGDQIVTLEDGFTIVNGGGHSLRASISGPAALRIGAQNTRYTFSVANDGLNDARAATLMISIPAGMQYQIDQANYFELPASLLPAGISPSSFPLHEDLNGRRFISLAVPIVKARSVVNIGINLSIPTSGSFNISYGVLPPWLDMLKGVSLNDPGPTIETVNLANMRPEATDAEIAACFAELARAMALALLNLVPGINCVDDAAQVVIPAVDFLTGYAWGLATGTASETSLFTGGVSFALSLLTNAAECAGQNIPAAAAANIAWTLWNLFAQLYTCLDLANDYGVSRPQSWDPNEKLGPDGFGVEKFVGIKQPLEYRINFENLATAGAPAQRIFILDALPPTLDARTVRLKEIGFKQNRIVIPDNQAFYQTRIQLGPDLNNLLADISAGLDIVNRRLTWTLTAIDPQTGERPLDPFLGLLPPNNEDRDGEGYVIFTVEAVATNPNRTEISNLATIYFDENEPIVTEPTSNMLDSTVPSSSVAMLPATSSNPQINYAWSGVDDTDGSGVRDCEIRISIDGGSFLPSQSSPLLSGSSQFEGKWGKRYAFYSICSDNAGNVELPPTLPDAETTVLGGDTEGDVAPRPNGNDGLLSVDDAEQVRRFVAGLDTDFIYNEFQRADMSPLDGGGNGILSVADVMQLRRFGSGLDPKADATGPNVSSGLAPKTVPGKNATMMPREIKAERITRIGNQLHVGIRLEAQGDETGIGFGLEFDTAVLSNPVVSHGPDASGSVLTVNSSDLVNGKLGVLLDRAPASPFTAGNGQVLTIVFDVSVTAGSSTLLTFGSDPIVAEVVDGTAASLLTTFSPSTIQLVGPTSAGVSVSGTVLRLNGNPLTNARVTITDAKGVNRRVTTNGFGLFRFEGIPAGGSYVVTVTAKGFVFAPRLINVDEEVSGLVFTPDP